MMEEIWKDIKGFEGRYQVSNMGRVKSLKRLIHHRASKRSKSFDRIITERIMKQHISNSGYLFVTLRSDEFQCGCFVHRLVANAFIPNPYDFKEVNHKDENKLNNIISNLEWCTAKYNVNYGTCQKRTQKGNIKNRKPIVQMTMDGAVVNKFKSIKEMYRLTGINREGVSRMCRGLKFHRNGTALISVGGFRWKYAD